MRLTVRADIEDRNFHSETHRNGGAEFHFTQNCRPLPDRPGFAFTPAPDRQLRVFSNAGVYHPQPEWCQSIPHPVEQSRGQVPSGDAYSPGWFDLPLALGKSVSVVLSADIPPPALELGGAFLRQPPGRRRAGLAPGWIPGGRRLRAPTGPGRARVCRSPRRGTHHHRRLPVVSGLGPRFVDLRARHCSRRAWSPKSRSCSITFGRFSAGGLMPNTLHGGDASNRDTSDAPLWYGVVCEEAAQLDETIYDRPAGAPGRNIADVLC